MNIENMRCTNCSAQVPVRIDPVKVKDLLDRNEEVSLLCYKCGKSWQASPEQKRTLQESIDDR